MLENIFKRFFLGGTPLNITQICSPCEGQPLWSAAHSEPGYRKGTGRVRRAAPLLSNSPRGGFVKKALGHPAILIKC